MSVFSGLHSKSVNRAFASAMVMFRVSGGGGMVATLIRVGVGTGDLELKVGSADSSQDSKVNSSASATMIPIVAPKIRKTAFRNVR